MTEDKKQKPTINDAIAALAEACRCSAKIDAHRDEHLAIVDAYLADDDTGDGESEAA